MTPDRLAIGAAFNDPRGTRPEKRALFDLIISDIHNTPKGGLIRWSAYSALETSLADALIWGHRNGRRVRVAIDNDSRGSKQVQRVAAELGTDPGADSCCAIINGTGRAAWGTTMHTKLYLTSDAGDGHPMSRVGSPNMASTHVSTYYNDLYSVRRRDLHRHLSDIHEQIMADKGVDEPYTHAAFGAMGYDKKVPRYEVATTPIMRPGRPHDDSRDLILTTLAQTPPKSNIYVQTHAWSGDMGHRLLNRLRDLSLDGGCTVYVNLGMHIGGNVRSTTMSPRLGFSTINTYQQAPRYAPHSKFIAVVAPQPRQSFVITGSRNFGDTPLDRHDEITFVVRGATPALAYREGFQVCRSKTPNRVRLRAR